MPTQQQSALMWGALVQQPPLALFSILVIAWLAQVDDLCDWSISTVCVSWTHIFFLHFHIYLVQWFFFFFFHFTCCFVSKCCALLFPFAWMDKILNDALFDFLSLNMWTSCIFTPSLFGKWVERNIVQLSFKNHLLWFFSHLNYSDWMFLFVFMTFFLFCPSLCDLVLFFCVGFVFYRHIWRLWDNYNYCCGTRIHFQLCCSQQHNRWPLVQGP